MAWVSHRTSLLRATLALIAAVLLTGLAAASSVAQDGSPQDAQVSVAQQLLDRHAPILLLKQQDHPCDANGEPYDAAPVEVVLSDQAVRIRRNLPDQPVVATAPTAVDLAGLDETYYLDLPGNPLRPGCVYERYSRERMRSLAPTAHARIAREAGRDGLAVQYWLFYVFNDFNNKHEGDWEMIQVVYDADSISEALQEDPVEVGYAQHGGGEWAEWDDPKLEREGDHPVVYVSRGSHASHFDSAVHLGWGENGTGFGCDVTTGPSNRVPLEAHLIPAPADATRADAWTTFRGRWGQREVWEFNGPLSPNVTTKWHEPLSWQETLRPSSLAVPLAGALGPAPTQAFCDVSATSADLFRTWVDRRWLAVSLVVLSLAIPAALIALTRHTLGSALALYLRHFPVFLPAAGAVIVVGMATSLVGWLAKLLLRFGPLADLPGVWSVITFLAGVTQHVVGLVLIAPAAIYAAAELRAGRRPDPLTLLRAERSKLGAVLRALFRPFLIIGLIGLLPLGVIPATYATVRRVFIPHAVVLDDAWPDAARTESLTLVEGRWWRTAALSAALAGIVAIPSPIVGILLLVFAARSIEFVNLASSLVYALVYPFAFAATTIFFLDRRAAMRDAVRTASAPPDPPHPTGTLVHDN